MRTGENSLMRPDVRGMTNALIDRARRGDARAFEQLAIEIERPLYRHAARMLGHDDAEDVVQDALLSAWRSLASFEGTSFRAWIFRIATNRALDRLRAKKRRPELPLDPPSDDSDESAWPEPAAPGPDLLQIAADREALGAVEEAIAALPEDQRAALLLRDVEGFAYEEIAMITMAEMGTVKSRIHRGRLAVRAALVARGWKGPGG